MFRVFLAFAIFFTIDITQLNADHSLAFLEFLVFNQISQASINNYLSAVKTMLQVYGIQTSAFRDPRVSYFTRALKLQAPYRVALQSIIDIPTLTNIVSTCDSMYMGQVYKACFLTSFFSFLRISNLVPHSLSTFNPLEQLARADIFFAPPGAHILIKWSKTLQSRNAVKIIKIPALGKSPLCPVRALKVILAITPGSDNSPLFQVKLKTKWFPLTDSRLRKNLALILSKIGLANANITFHSFRRSGATLAFNSSVPLQDIQSHGTWTSDCVWSYITQDHNASQVVAHTFASLLTS